MKVDPNLQPLANASSGAVENSKTSRAQQSTETASTQTPAAGSSDTVQVSSRFAEVQQLTSKLQQVPEVRSNRVAALKAKIQQGTYKPASSDVANAVLNDPLNQLSQASNNQG